MLLFKSVTEYSNPNLEFFGHNLLLFSPSTPKIGVNKGASAVALPKTRDRRQTWCAPHKKPSTRVSFGGPLVMAKFRMVISYGQALIWVYKN